MVGVALAQQGRCEIRMEWKRGTGVSGGLPVALNHLFSSEALE